MALNLTLAAPVAVALFGLLLGLGLPPVTEWFWPTPTTNLAEAALLGDAARVRHLAATGVSLDAPMPIREELIEGDVPPVISAVAAAMGRGHDDVVQLLLELGARPPASTISAAAP